jgi:hypothetical protein
MQTLKFAPFVNFVVCSWVTLSGLYFLRKLTQEYEPEKAYIVRSYFWWWLSWLVWTFTWFTITFWDWEHIHHTTILGLSDLNAILLIALYFSLTRGKKYKHIPGLIDFLGLALAIAVGYKVFHEALPERFASLQAGWGLCLSAISTLLVGWAFAFRYKTRAILIVGFVYAFAQPLTFEALLTNPAGANQAAIQLGNTAVILGLAVLKVFWSSVVTSYFIREPANKEDISFEFRELFSLPGRGRMVMPFWIQTIASLGLVAALLIWGASGRMMTKPTIHEVYSVLGALAALVVIFGGIGRAMGFLKATLNENTARPR